jgi:hypothetical protein
MDFITELKKDTKASELDDYNLKDAVGKSATIDTGSFLRIEWAADIDARKWGIKCIDFHFKKVTGSIYWLAIEDNDDGTNDTGVIEIDSSEGWEIVDKLTVTEFGRVCPNEAEIDFKKKTITIL